MTSGSNIFEKFTHNLGIVAERWSDEKTELVKPAGAVEAFEEAAIFAQIKAAHKNKELERFTRGNVQRGMNTFARFNYMSALAIRREGIIDIAKVEAILRDGRSFSFMDYLARQNRKVAGEVEYAQGLSQNMASDQYVVVRDGAIDMPGFDDEVAMQARIHSGGSESCDARRAGVLEPIYQHIVTIGLKDPSLITAVLALNKQTTIKSE